MNPDERWHYRVNGGDEQSVFLRTSLYCCAAAAIPAVDGRRDWPWVIEVWVPRLLPDYGPYIYYIAEPGAAALSVNAYVAAVAIGYAIAAFFQKEG
jgi:hypothetical protein